MDRRRDRHDCVRADRPGRPGGSSHSTTAAATATFDNVVVESLWSNQDIGAVGLAGSTSITNGVFTLTGAGRRHLGRGGRVPLHLSAAHGRRRDCRPRGHLSATNVWHKVGVMIRKDLTPGSAHGMMLVSSARGLAFQRRVTSAGHSTNTTGPLLAAPRWVHIARSGDVITASCSNDRTDVERGWIGHDRDGTDSLHRPR